MYKIAHPSYQKNELKMIIKGENIWLEWSDWSRCIKGAGHGVKFRKR